MMRVAWCIAQEHDLRLVILALLVALVGSAATIQLSGRIRSTRGYSRLGWIVLTAVGTGTMVWATHFVAMMAFRTRAPVVLDPVLTLVSLLAAIVLAAPGLAIAVHRRRWAGLLGGGIVGIAISIMHYLGMTAYRVDGLVTWDPRYVAASVALSTLIAAQPTTMPAATAVVTASVVMVRSDSPSPSFSTAMLIAAMPVKCSAATARASNPAALTRLRTPRPPKT